VAKNAIPRSGILIAEGIARRFQDAYRGHGVDQRE
jgi:hypothetical protein